MFVGNPYIYVDSCGDKLISIFRMVFFRDLSALGEEQEVFHFKDTIFQYTSPAFKE